MTQHFSFVTFVACMLVLLFFACKHMDTIEVRDGREHHVSRRTVVGIPYSTDSRIILTDAELEQDAKAATAALKQEMERRIAEAEADKQAAKDRADAFETRVGSLTKLAGFALIAIGLVVHLFVSVDKLKSIGSSIYTAGAVVVLIGIVIKWSVGWELWLLIGSLVVGIPMMYILRKKGLIKPKEGVNGTQ